MNNFLNEIIIHKRKEIIREKKKFSQCELVQKISHIVHKKRDFKKAILTPKVGTLGIIAEIKLASPSTGQLGNRSEIKTRLLSYAQADADGLSIVVDRKYFGGNLDFIPLAKQLTSLSVLCKDFILDEYQIYKAKYYGADALLLIAKIVDLDKLVKFVKLVMKLNMEPVVEIQTQEELGSALKTECRCLAVNARNIDDFSVDIQEACEIIQIIPADKIALGLSGIKTKEDMKAYKQAGAKAVIVGTSVMKTKNIIKFLGSLR